VIRIKCSAGPPRQSSDACSLQTNQQIFKVLSLTAAPYVITSNLCARWSPRRSDLAHRERGRSRSNDDRLKRRHIASRFNDPGAVLHTYSNCGAIL
jgi:hypothetical protein